MLRVKLLKRNNWVQIFDSFGNQIFGKQRGLVRQQSFEKKSAFREDFSPMMRQYSKNSEEQIDEELEPDTIKLIIPVYHKDKKLLLKQDIEMI